VIKAGTLLKLRKRPNAASKACFKSNVLILPGSHVVFCKLTTSSSQKGKVQHLHQHSEVWGVDEKIGDAAELLHRQFLKHILGVRDSYCTANVIVLAELGRFPLCFHWWQQILRYHNRINNLSDDERLIKCAFVEGMHDLAHLFWSHKVHSWLQGKSVGLSIEDDLDVSTVIGNAKNHYAQTWHQRRYPQNNLAELSCQCLKGIARHLHTCICLSQATCT